MVVEYVFRQSDPCGRTPRHGSITRPRIRSQHPQVIERLKTESPIERRLFDALVFNGYAPVTQVRCGKYRIDLASSSVPAGARVRRQRVAL